MFENKYEKLDFVLLRKLVRLGLTDKELADCLDVHLGTFQRWKTKHPDFAEALKEWKEEADERVERSLYERACGYSHADEKIHIGAFGSITRAAIVKHYPPDTGACTLWLTNRQPEKWAAKQKYEHSGEMQYTSSSVNEVDLEERIKRIKEKKLEDVLQ